MCCKACCSSAETQRPLLLTERPVLAVLEQCLCQQSKSYKWLLLLNWFLILYQSLQFKLLAGSQIAWKIIGTLKGGTSLALVDTFLAHSQEFSLSALLKLTFKLPCSARSKPIILFALLTSNFSILCTFLHFIPSLAIEVFLWLSRLSWPFLTISFRFLESTSYDSLLLSFLLHLVLFFPFQADNLRAWEVGRFRQQHLLNDNLLPGPDPPHASIWMYANYRLGAGLGWPMTAADAYSGTREEWRFAPRSHQHAGTFLWRGRVEISLAPLHHCTGLGC